LRTHRKVTHLIIVEQWVALFTRLCRFDRTSFNLVKIQPVILASPTLQIERHNISIIHLNIVVLVGLCILSFYIINIYIVSLLQIHRFYFELIWICVWLMHPIKFEWMYMFNYLQYGFGFHTIIKYSLRVHNKNIFNSSIKIKQSKFKFVRSQSNNMLLISRMSEYMFQKSEFHFLL
jgi:hypothetical protein